MSRIDLFFKTDQESDHSHPLIQFLKREHLDEVAVEVDRPGNMLGYKPAKFFVHIVQNGKKLTPTEYEWDDDLNEELIQQGIRAVSEENEKQRFGLALRAGFRKAENRYGDGFFNAVLGEFIKESGFEEFSEVAEVLKDIHTNKPYKGRRGSYEDCQAQIKHAIQIRAQDLTERLKYPQPTAEQILAGAVARYLDERFTVSDRRRLGWT